MASIETTLQQVRTRIANACLSAGRPVQSVTLLAVSKPFDATAVRAAHAAGQRAFGENYVQEATQKMDALGAPGLEWHLIGPLQSNKTRLAAERFAWVHTVASEKIARRLSEQRPDARGPLNVLIQVNASGEDTKSGIAPSEAAALAFSIRSLKKLRLRGLMAIPEPTGDAALQRARFAEVRRLLEDLNRQGLHLDTLSMGMSGDMESAIAEGSTLVRVGTAIFGARARQRHAA